jgi:hypothetical protein
VEAIVEQAAPGTPVVYLGDDLTDEAAFQTVNGMENPHLSVLVWRRLRVTAAEVWLRPPEGLRWFLRQWENAVRGLPVKRLQPCAYDSPESADASFVTERNSFAQEDAR